ncbi:MAG: TetR/AcrR family transcriptional regulator, partial [Solirubrobacteraceae bacterium]
MSYRLAARDLLRNTLLDAALDLLRERAWSEITMADVAAAAGTSRQTLYSEFGSRAEFAQAAVAREGERFLVAAHATIDAHRDDPAQALARAFGEFLAAAAENPLVRAIVAPDGDGMLLALVTTRGGPFVEAVGARLSELLVATWPQFPRREARPLAECLVRLAISHAALPLQAPRRTASAVTALLAPYLEQALSGQPA